MSNEKSGSIRLFFPIHDVRCVCFFTQVVVDGAAYLKVQARSVAVAGIMININRFHAVSGIEYRISNRVNAVLLAVGATSLGLGAARH